MSYTEHTVARADELSDGEMKQVTAGETDVLLARIGGVYHAVYAYCSHYGAPLADGALSGDRVVCPWHHACFHLPTGDQLEPPGIDSLPRFETRIEGDEVIVRVPDRVEETRVAEMAARDEADGRTFVVLGAGAAGAYAAEAIREAGFTGRLVMIAAETERPYDRVNCSKDYLQGEIGDDEMPLRSRDFYQAHGVEIMSGQRAETVDAEAKTITLEDGTSLAYDALVLCTGGRPRCLDVPGADLGGIFILRSLADSQALREAAGQAKQAVVIGASFIGLEAAWSLRELGLAVTVVAPEKVPLAKVVGERVGKFIRSIHEDHDVRFKLEEEVAAFNGNGVVAEVALKSGETLEADLVVVGIGVEPATDFLRGVERMEGGGISVDEHLRAADGLYAAGDIAAFPDWRTGGRVRIEHWRTACQHGRLAGYNMGGRRVAYRSIPFFWSAQHGNSLRYVGHAEDWDEEVYDGEVEEGKFIAYYVKSGQVLAAFGMGRDQEMAAIEELIRRNEMPTPDVLRGGDGDLLERLREAEV